jgi:hypothetical protein
LTPIAAELAKIASALRIDASDLVLAGIDDAFATAVRAYVFVVEITVIVIVRIIAHQNAPVSLVL